MIGVSAPKGDHDVVAEFFELFKTPWEFHVPGHTYDVVLVCQEKADAAGAKLVVEYGAGALGTDSHLGVVVQGLGPAPLLTFEGQELPIYKGCSSFPGAVQPFLCEAATGAPVGFHIQRNGTVHARLGYDLFREVRHLLVQGQPVRHANSPTLDLHISVLRRMITTSSLPLLEVPPAPHQATFVACLTHDVDHPVLRNHRLDHTAWGFLYRAIVGSVVGLLRGCRTPRELMQNWLAALRLPWVYLGLAKDFWRRLDRYADLESDAGSTFFVIPFKNEPGRDRAGTAPSMRASRYDVTELGSEITQLRQRGCEIGVHGLNAWLDPAEGRREQDRVCGVAPTADLGIRMHWLYFDADAPASLEAAGFAYDSTIGYNETVGFRAGTLQAYRPPGLRHIMELPLHVMDTALFYPDRLGLSPTEARSRVSTLLGVASRHGGVLTFNWHDRSIAPERLWDGVYQDLLADLRRAGAWLCGAGAAVRWFRKRRSVVMRQQTVNGRAHVTVSLPDQRDAGPPLRVRLHRPPPPGSATGSSRTPAWEDLPLKAGEQLSISV